ncbi:ankyrin repeat-containing domain protein [Desarmillaria tabescens]|uniref:Ankyrin repeat-containing domain protein n=1 Tax=Armillaria tabescens TaxID=1929756 RepID=A0AA39JCI8_ARMTA|nr:ankyrin repeat-containing domain protein [Desarmillaria tabescens]KAK0438148.1 ankyrin repeat-containing domain protein [Desarmillaria tabescens]
MSIITWLTDLNFKSVQADKLSQRVGDTGRWFLESEQFRSWVDGSVRSSRLWCPGNPGVGKTILSSIVIDYLQSLDYEEKTLILRIFCDYQSAATQTIANLFCSLLKQLIQDHGLSPSITSLYNELRRKQTRPSLGALTKILSQELESFHRVYIVLDALDEFIDNNGGREELIDMIKSLGDNIHLCVTSRVITTIGTLFEEDTRLDIRASDDDIKAYITTKLSCGRLARLIKGRDDLRQEILDGITEKADGMFLLAGLHMDSLAQSTTPKILRVALGKLPDNMAGAYDKTLERVNSQGEHDRDLAYRIFGWIAFAARPLTVLELRYALAVELGTTALDPDNLCNDDLLGSVCAGLVIMDQPNWIFRYYDISIVRFVHYTTQEYFMSRQDDLFPGFGGSITRTCLTYMTFNDIDIPRPCIPEKTYTVSFFGSPLALLLRDIEKHMFLNYSYSYWGYHASGLVQYSIEREIIAFLDVAHHRQVADMLRTRHMHWPPSPVVPPSPLQSAVHQGLVHITEVLLNQGADPREELPLVVAAEVGHLEIVKLLLSRDDVDVNQADPKNFHTPLMEAARNGHEEVIKAILASKHMNSLNSVDKDGNSALFHAIYKHRSKVVRILLATPGINATSCNHIGFSPLAAAVYGRLKDDVDPNGRSPETQWTPLSYAAESGYAHIATMLLQTGRVDVNSRDCKERTALMTAAVRGNVDAVKVLLGHPGIAIMAKDKNGKTAYSHAYLQRLRRLDDFGIDGVIALLEEYGGGSHANDYLPTR